MTNLDVKLKIDSWDEQPTMECPDGTKLSRTDVRLSGVGDVSAARAQSLLFYRADRTSAFVWSIAWLTPGWRVGVPGGTNAAGALRSPSGVPSWQPRSPKRDSTRSIDSPSD